MRTKVVTDYIIDALFELLKKKELNQITINELVKKAGVCRSSFYRNFFLLEDVIKKYFNDLLSTIIFAFPLDLNQIETHSEYVYAELLKSREKLTLLESRGLLHLMDDAIYSSCSKQIEIIKQESNEYLTYFYTGASAFVIRTWIKKNFAETPHELAIYTKEAINSYIVK